MFFFWWGGLNAHMEPKKKICIRYVTQDNYGVAWAGGQGRRLIRSRRNNNVMPTSCHLLITGSHVT